MAYRLKSSKPLPKQLVHVLAEQFQQTAVDMLATDPDGKAIHDARKRIKKIRAIVHLLRARLRAHGRRIDAILRSVGHRLSSDRDGDAAFETLETLRCLHPRVISKRTAAVVRRGLLSRERREGSHIDSIHVRRSVERAAKELPHHIRRSATPRAVYRGTASGYRRARTAMESLAVEPSDVAFHRWRRRVKDHWYQIRLLAGIHRRLTWRANRLKRLETWLGIDHNLVVLRLLLLDRPIDFGTEAQTAAVLGCIEKSSASFRKRALRLGAALFREKQPKFVKSFHRR
jgi:hypothetical protein